MLVVRARLSQRSLHWCQSLAKFTDDPELDLEHPGVIGRHWQAVPVAVVLDLRQARPPTAFTFAFWTSWCEPHGYGHCGVMAHFCKQKRSKTFSHFFVYNAGPPVYIGLTMRQAMYDEELLARLDEEEAAAMVLPQQELLNCLAEAENVVFRHNANALANVPNLLAAGKVVIVSWHTYHCKSTDANAGEMAHVVGILDNPEQVDAWFAKVEADRVNFGYAIDDEERLEVLGDPRRCDPLPVDMTAGATDGVDFVAF